ncbi:MAG TPA: hypothetical protein VGU45_01615 [Microvirga sp.]|jgi:hypothetical protein|nr:hypothetical protein [Microvirga sp.]
MGFAFRPTGATVTAAGSTTSTAAQAIGFEGIRPSIRIYNSTSAVAYCAFGASGVGAATAADYPVPPSSSEVITLTPDQTHVRVLLSTGTGNVFFTPGSQGTI